MLYRIFTEDLNQVEIERILRIEFESYTLLHGLGYWSGSQERTIVIEVIGARLLKKIRKVAKEIKSLNSQDAVLIECLTNHNEIV